MEVIADVRQTSEACPSQWTVDLHDGRRLYVRYRWGWLSIANRGNEEWPFYKALVGGPLDGVMDTDEMVRLVEQALQIDT